MPKAWKILPKHSEDLIKQLLFNRKVKTEKEEEKFFNPELLDFEKDLGIPGISAAKKRIEKAIEGKELIFIFGDYDADGVCGSAVLYLGLTTLGAKVLPYIPHREKEGYGLSEEGLKVAKEKGASLIITVDNGIVAIKGARIAKKLGMDLIITDHHTPLEEKPEALSIILSQKMCGTAVAWCLIRQLVERGEAEDLLDLVAIATVCDLIPLLGINRCLVKMGLEKINQTKRAGLLALISEAGLERGKITAYQIGHILGPRLNASGRLETAMDSLRLLCTKDIEKARNLARLLCETNDKKKELTTQALLEIKEMIDKENQDTMAFKKILVFYSPNWKSGIIGLLAGRISDEYKTPTIAISCGETESKGSARSNNGLNIVETLRLCSDLLLDVGGHPGAAGFTIETKKIESFKKRLEEVAQKNKLAEDENLKIEAVVTSEKINKKLVSELDKFEPTGMDNPKPILASFGAKISGIRVVGNGQHLKCKIDGIEAIAFSFGFLSDRLKEGQLVDAAFLVELNRFNGSETLQLKILDLKPLY